MNILDIGVDIIEIYRIKELLEKELISRSRAKDSRSFILHTTKKFAEYFKLKGDAKTLAKYLDMNKDIINS